MINKCFTKRVRKSDRIRSLVYSMFVWTLIGAIFYFAGVRTNSVQAENSKPLAPVLATVTFPTSTALPLAIPDNTSAGTALNIPVAGLTDQLRGVALNITFDQPAGGGGHTWVGDINMTLTSPSASHLIMQRVGSATGTGSGDSTDIQGPYTFTDGTTGDFWGIAVGMVGGTVPPGAYRTMACCTGAPTDMNPVFAGPVLVEPGIFAKKETKEVSIPLPADAANGNWTLNVSDNAAGDTGRVSALSLTLTTLAPTAARAFVSGRVVTPSGSGIARARVSILNTSNQNTIGVLTNSFGYFKIEDLPVGNIYILSVGHKEYQFAVSSQSFTLNDNISDTVFISN